MTVLPTRSGEPSQICRLMPVIGEGVVGLPPMYGKKVIDVTFHPHPVTVKSSATRKAPDSEWLKPRLVRPAVVSIARLSSAPPGPVPGLLTSGPLS